MKKLLRIGAAAIAASLFLAACGERVEVPPAHVGKVLTKNGYKPETIPPSKFRLDPCWAYCDRLVTLLVADRGHKESFTLFMPVDQLNMTFDIRFTYAVGRDEKDITQLFDRVPAVEYPESGGWHISGRSVYQTYGQPVLREVIRTTLAKYSINEVASNREPLNQELFAAVQTALTATPIYIKQLGFADIQFPTIITEAKEAAAQRRIDIEKAEASAAVRLVELEKELEEERMRRNIRKERAQAILEENQIIEKSVSPSYLAYRQLEVLEAMAKNQNAVFVPFDALHTLGLQNRIFEPRRD